MYIYNLREDDFDKIIDLGNVVHGENYLNHTILDDIMLRSCIKGLNSSFVVYQTERSSEDTLIAFRLTYAPGMWEPDEWCSVDKWTLTKDKMCYFKSNTIHKDFRGQGLGTILLDRSIDVVKRQGAEAGIAHIWMQSPANSAYNYFTKAGGELIAIWPDIWKKDHRRNGYVCSVDGTDCSCDGAEMILHFKEGRKPLLKTQ